MTVTGRPVAARLAASADPSEDPFSTTMTWYEGLQLLEHLGERPGDEIRLVVDGDHYREGGAHLVLWPLTLAMYRRASGADGKDAGLRRTRRCVKDEDAASGVIWPS
jgi:hypothetical protein